MAVSVPRPRVDAFPPAAWGFAGRRIRRKRAAGQATRSVPVSRAAERESTGRDWKTSLVVAGGGLAGLATAVAFKSRAIPFVLVERAQSLRDGEGTAIALWKNAWVALDALGVGDELRANHPTLDRFELCDTGRVLRRFDARNEFRGVRRGEIASALASKLDEGDIVFGKEVVHAETTSNGARVTFSDGTTTECAAVVGCDGARSKVAQSLGLALPSLTGYSAFRGVAVFDKDENDGNATRYKAIFGRGVRAGMYQMSPTETYWFIIFNNKGSIDGDGPRSGAAMRKQALDKVRGWAHGIERAVQATDENRIVFSRIGESWRLCNLGTLPRGELITLAGDAAHPMTPNLGQGGCCAMEDAVVLAKAVAGAQSFSGASLAARLRLYESARWKRWFKLTVRASLMGMALQWENGFVCRVRNLFMEKLYNPNHFLDHTEYDCTAAKLRA